MSLTISRDLDEVLASERDAAEDLDRRFAEEHASIKTLLESIQKAKLEGRWRKTSFNIFEVMGRPRLEEAHSSFLAWLLNPDEAHGLGEAFLREMCRRSVGKKAPPNLGVSVIRELRSGGIRFDIYVKGDGWCLIVENKIDDFPWDEQCRAYQEYCRRIEDRGEQAWLVYVTPNEQPASKVPWISYREIRRILEFLKPHGPAAAVIQQFCEHILSDLEA